MASETRVRQDAASWQAGYNAGTSGGTSDCPPEVPDRLAYASGFVEGEAARDRVRAALAAGQDGEG